MSVDIFAIMSIAFLSSFGHCIGMCGGIVLAFSSTKIKSSWSKERQHLAHIIYSFGRVTTYVFLGVIFSFWGKLFEMNTILHKGLLFVVGATMILFGFSLLKKIKILKDIEHSIQNSKWFHDIFSKLLKNESLKSFYLLGVLNGLIPCGLVYFFLMSAIASGSVLSGALIMFIFGVSTIPALFSLGFFVNFFKSTSFRQIMMKLSSIGIVLYGVYFIYRALNLEELLQHHIH